MTIKEEIEFTFKKYLQALYTGEYKILYSLLYEDDIQKYRNKIIEFSHKMDVFGETQDFLDKLGFSSIEELENLSLFDFITSILKMTGREIGEKKLKKVLKETVITAIEEVEYLNVIEYEYPIYIFDEWELLQGKIEMIKSEGQWKILLKSGMESGLNRFQEEIDRYMDRKNRDNIDNIQFEGDLTPYTITGYKDFMTGKVVFEPRFKDAGEFSNGLAPVQIMKKYGYINLKGEIQIKPQFIKAKIFSQKMASVRVLDENNKKRWGFINNKGILKIKPKYTSTSNFSEGLCAVSLQGKWGYINKKGEIIIPLKFDSVDDFDDGTAYAEILSTDGEPIEFVIDKKGKITEMD